MEAHTEGYWDGDNWDGDVYRRLEEGSVYGGSVYGGSDSNSEVSYISILI